MLAFVLCLTGPRFAFAEDLKWDLPLGIGTFQLPFQSHEMVGGLDFVLREAIAGYSTPVATLWKEIDLSVGAVGAFPRTDSKLGNKVVEPYLGGGVDIKKHLPPLSKITSLHLNAFGRYSTEVGKPGAGIAASYKF